MAEQLGKFVAPKLSAAPSSPVAGQMWYDTSVNKLKWYNGSTWIEAEGGGGGPTDYGLVEALPGSPAKGDFCSFYADKANGIVWRFTYDGEGTYPWKKIGGEPLRNEVETNQTTTSTSYANLTTEGPKITVPLKGDYDVTIGCRTGGAAANLKSMSFAVGGVSANDGDAIESGANTFATLQRTSRKTALTASTVLLAKYKTAGETAEFKKRWMLVDAIRTG